MAPANLELTPAASAELRRHVQRLCGLALSEDKSYLIIHRLGPIVEGHRLSGFDELALRLRDGGPLADAVVEAITTAETSFFRDGHPFEALRRHLLPGLTAVPRGRPVRFWSAACSTGQEPYSVAMLVREHLAAAPWLSAGDFSILGTDVSARVLRLAEAGEYSKHEVARGLSPVQLGHHFERRGDRWRVREAVRALVRFRRANLLAPPPDLGTFDVILCRNVLIYFDDATRRRVCDYLDAALAPGGWLLLGAAENLYGVSDRFASVSLGETLLYHKT